MPVAVGVVFVDTGNEFDFGLDFKLVQAKRQQLGVGRYCIRSHTA